MEVYENQCKPIEYKETVKQQGEAMNINASTKNNEEQWETMSVPNNNRQQRESAEINWNQIEVEENQWKSMRIRETIRKSMKSIENQCKSI